MTRSLLGLTGIDVESGTADDGGGNYRGFVNVRATAGNGDIMMGQIDPETVRRMAMNFLEIAETADQDAIVMTMLVQDVGLAPETAVNFIVRMRERRIGEQEGEETDDGHRGPEETATSGEQGGDAGSA